MSLIAISPGSGNSGSTSSFDQQGSVDWVSLSSSTLSFSVEVLARLSRAGIELITLAMGRATCSTFRLQPDAQRRLTNTLSQLPVMSSYGRLVWFGFGVKHVITDLADTEQGLACVGLTAALSVSYDAQRSAEVMRKLCEVRGGASGLMPSVRQWMALVNTCAGSISSSQFPLLVEGLSRLFNAHGESALKKLPVYYAAPAEPLARALAAIAEVSSVRTESITIVGGIDCAWLAAVSQWLLSLRIEILDAAGDYLYQSSQETTGSAAQVRFIRPSGENSHIPQLYDKTLVIPSNSWFSSLINLEKKSLFTKGQSEWNTILKDAFGSHVEVLISGKFREAFAYWFYCQSYRAAAHVQGEGNLLDIPLTPDLHFGYPDSRGSAHIAFATKTLPELSGALRQYLDFNDRGTKPRYEILAARSLRDLCSCHLCMLPVQEALERSCKSDEGCFRVLAETIMTFTCILASCHLGEGLRPSSTGLLLLYRQKQSEEESRVLFENGHMHPRSDIENSRPRLLATVHMLFSGALVAHQKGDTPDQAPTAAASGGIVTFSNAFLEINAPPTDLTYINVLYGSIGYAGSTYDIIRDLKTPSYIRSYNMLSFRTSWQPELKVRETTNSRALQVAWVIHSDERLDAWLGISKLHFIISKFLRLPKCAQPDCRILTRRRQLGSERAGHSVPTMNFLERNMWAIDHLCEQSGSDHSPRWSRPGLRSQEAVDDLFESSASLQRWAFLLEKPVRPESAAKARPIAERTGFGACSLSLTEYHFEMHLASSYVELYGRMLSSKDSDRIVGLFPHEGCFSCTLKLKHRFIDPLSRLDLDFDQSYGNRAEQEAHKQRSKGNKIMIQLPHGKLVLHNALQDATSESTYAFGPMTVRRGPQGRYFPEEGDHDEYMTYTGHAAWRNRSRKKAADATEEEKAPRSRSASIDEQQDMSEGDSE